MPKNKILVVDDEKSMREFLEIMLRRDGYDVESAESGAIALEKRLRAISALASPHDPRESPRPVRPRTGRLRRPPLPRCRRPKRKASHPNACGNPTVGSGT